MKKRYIHAMGSLIWGGTCMLPSCDVTGCFSDGEAFTVWFDDGVKRSMVLCSRCACGVRSVSERMVRVNYDFW